MKELNQNHVKYGLIMGVVLMICLILMEVSGQNKTFDKSFYVTFATMFAPIIVWYFGIRERRQQLKGKLTYKQGVTEGFKISLVFAVISPFIFLSYYVFINPAILSSVKQAYHMQGVSDQEIIGVDMLIQFLSAIIFGTIYGAIISLLLKTKTK